MIQQEPAYNPGHSSTVINANSIQGLRKIVIYSNDPRNNQSYLSELTLPYEIIPIENEYEKDFSYGDFKAQDFTQENTDPSIIMSLGYEHPVTVNNFVSSEEGFGSMLNEPQNLAILSNSYRLQDYGTSGDGSVNFIASLSFDDVIGATDYDFSITAVE